MTDPSTRRGPSLPSRAGNRKPPDAHEQPDPDVAMAEDLVVYGGSGAPRAIGPASTAWHGTEQLADDETLLVHPPCCGRLPTYELAPRVLIANSNLAAGDLGAFQELERAWPDDTAR